MLNGCRVKSIHMHSDIYVYIYIYTRAIPTTLPSLQLRKTTFLEVAPSSSLNSWGFFFFVGVVQMNGSTVFGVEVDMEDGHFTLNLSENVTRFRKGWLLGHRYGTWCPASYELVYKLQLTSWKMFDRSTIRNY
jgi:hypothetical protein